MIESNSVLETSYSDNSHLFGIPFVIKQSDEAYMTILHKELRDYVEKVINLPVEFHFEWLER